MAERFCRRQADATTTKSLNFERALVPLHEEVASVYSAIQHYSWPILSVLSLCCDNDKQQHPDQDFGN